MDQTSARPLARLDRAAVRSHKVPDLVRALDVLPNTGFRRATGGHPQEEDPELSAT